MLTYNATCAVPTTFDIALRLKTRLAIIEVSKSLRSHSLTKLSEIKLIMFMVRSLNYIK